MESRKEDAELKAIVILMDSLNRRALDAYDPDSRVMTPNLRRLSERSVVFDQHWSGSLPCMPARKDLFTGRMDFLERGWGGMEPYCVTLQDTLKKHDVYSHLTTDHYHYFATGGENYCQSFNSWDFHRGQEGDTWVSRVDEPALPQEYYGQVRPQYEKNRTRLQKEEDYSGPRTIQSACQWLEDNRNSDNFFLMVECFDPHEPFDCPKPYLELYGDAYTGPRYDWPAYGKREAPEEAMSHLRNRYAALVTMMDHWLGRLLDQLDQLSLWDDTMIIFTTDHGFMLGEHDWTGKNVMHVYNEIAHIPLMIHLPGGRQAGRRVSALTQIIDIMPTLLQYYGIDIPDTVKGHSLLGLASGLEHKVRDYALYGYHGKAVNMTDGQYTYFRSPAHPDNYPCYTYTAMPTTFRKYHGSGNEERIAMGRYLKYTDFPVFRFPVAVQGKEDPNLEPVRASQLFDLAQDYEQLRPIQDEQLERRLATRMKEEILTADGPEEQIERLGL